MYNNYPNYYPQIQSQQQRSYLPNLKGRPVSSLDEVRATSVDFDGSLFFFPDIANKKIYTKQINVDGTATINMYEFKNIPVEQVATNPSYVTKEEFDETLKKIQGMFDTLTNQIPSTPSVPPSPEREFKF